MKCLLTIAPLAAVGFLHAQTPEAKPRLNPDDIQRLLVDRDGKPSELSKTLLGGGNTNRLFYFPTHDEPATPPTGASASRTSISNPPMAPLSTAGSCPPS